MKDYASTILISLLFASLLVFILMISETYPASLTWEAPVENIDGTELNDLAGYVIYVQKDCIGDFIEIENVGLVEFYPVNLDTTMTCFKMTAYDLNMNISPESEILKFCDCNTQYGSVK